MIDFLWPWLFLLLPLPWILRYLLPPAQPSVIALRVPFFQRLPSATPSSLRSPAWRRLGPALVIWTLLLGAAAQPRWLGTPESFPVSGRDLTLLIDISGSMRAMDFTLNEQPADRLTVVKQVAGKFIRGRAGDRLGLIVFGEQPFLRASLSYDYRAIEQLLDESEVALAGEFTAVGDAIGLAIKRMRELPADNRVIILLTDGGNNSGRLPPLQAARLAAHFGIRIYALGVGRQDVAGPNPYGAWSTEGAAEFDREILQQIAQVTGGLYFDVLDTHGLEQAYQRLDLLEPSLRDELKAYSATALYPWPLGLALGLSLGLVLLRMGWTFRWKH